MRKELYINSKLVELDSSTNIDLQFKSFLFSGISEVTAPRSWTVSLPKSAANLALVEGASSGDADTDFPYNNYTVDYYQNGYHLINSGKAVLIKITDRIEFVFTFGKAYEAIKAMGETKLIQLEETALDYLTWNRSINLTALADDVGWCNFYSFTNEDRTYDPLTGHDDVPFSVLHPAVTFNYIMNKIQEFFAVSLVGISSFVGGCSFPLKSFDGVSTIDRSTSDSTTFIGVNNITGNIFFTVAYSDIYEKNLEYFNIKNKVVVSCEINVSLEVTLTSDIGGANPLAITGRNEEGSFVYNVIRNPSNPLVYNLSYTGNFIGGKNNFFYFTAPVFNSAQIASCDLVITQSVKQANYSENTTGGFFPIIPNLPDMTCADFIFQAMQLAGVFPSISDDDPTTINFFSADVLYDNIGSAKDWSAKLVKKMPRRSELSDVAFKFGSYAKSNVLQYKKDETNLLNTSSSLTVDNENLEKESTLVDLKFAAGKRFSVTDTFIDYPLYDIKIDGTTLIRNPKSQSNDVIAEIVNVGGINYLKFTDTLLWSSLKTANYTGYQSLIEKPRYLREKFHLKPQDVANLDMEIPIYLEQYGKYYAIMQLQYKDNEFSECELLEIKNI